MDLTPAQISQQDQHHAAHRAGPAGHVVRRVAGARWRVLAHAWDAKKRMHGPSFEAGSIARPTDPWRDSLVIPDMEIDEVVIDRWFHLEQMSAQDWWLCVGGVVLNVRVDREGRPRAVLVEVEPEPGVEYRGEVGGG